ncbi:protease inhibitor SIL-V5 [Streptomyces lunaelactis]|uniref:SSI family serine proteinase inhibitor n=1 Tax=Streptomyces lunaelactis TaxID=1535768 RepID=UPI00158521EB|nr:SSI family serine proteinase inhibitor [Streptomyces lunaelactis]NUL02526.1 protease inhibitor SIL-V5 [Streptomyces lunaelactis]
MHRMATLAAAALVALVAGVPAHAAPAHAAPAVGEAPKPAPGLFLTLSGADNTWIRGVLLQCPVKPGGPHPHAAAACRALSVARGDLDVLPGDPHPCDKRFDPVTVGATGTWRGRLTAWHKTYANACELDAATGAVFRF